ncbi:MAG: DinB family protein [Armatimonadota bacterium]
MPSNYYLQIENTPSTLIRMVDSIRPELYDTSLEGDRFTLKEVVAHLADLEQTWLDRITTAIEFPGKAVEPFNEEARAVEHKYSEKDIHHELEVFDNRRRDTVDYLLRLADDDWANTITHPDKGEMTVLEIVQYITGHDLYHVHQVSQYLK